MALASCFALEGEGKWGGKSLQDTWVSMAVFHFCHEDTLHPSISLKHSWVTTRNPFPEALRQMSTSDRTTGSNAPQVHRSRWGGAVSGLEAHIPGVLEVGVPADPSLTRSKGIPYLRSGWDPRTLAVGS